MDYKTYPIKRQSLREIASILRKIFGCKNKYKFNVVDSFERIHSLFPNIYTEVVEDEELERNIPARCLPDFANNEYLIQVKNSVYEGACDEIGGYRAHILHEICHAILCILGFVPIMDRQYKNNEIKCYESMEWQAKALCGEILMPYEETQDLSITEIMRLCNVSRDSAEKRKTY